MPNFDDGKVRVTRIEVGYIENGDMVAHIYDNAGRYLRANRDEDTGLWSMDQLVEVETLMVQKVSGLIDFSAMLNGFVTDPEGITIGFQDGANT